MGSNSQTVARNLIKARELRAQYLRELLLQALRTARLLLTRGMAPNRPARTG